jgi:prophage tail gpP-like protein
MSAWDALQQVCEKNGCWPYVAPDGTLVIGGPDYTVPPVATLIMRRDGKGNNVLRLAHRRGIQDRYSEVTVLGQSHGTERTVGGHNIRATAKDSAAPWYRPKIVVEADCDSTAHASRRARKIITDGCLAGMDLTATVRGHRVIGPNSKPGTGAGLLWMPGQRVRVLSEPHRIDGVYYLMRRTFLGSRAGGQTTELGLKLDGMWQPDVGHHRKHKKGGQGEGRVVDL